MPRKLVNDYGLPASLFYTLWALGGGMTLFLLPAGLKGGGNRIIRWIMLGLFIPAAWLAPAGFVLAWEHQAT